MNSDYGTCLYIRCDYEVGLWFLLFATVFFICYWLIGYIGKQFLLRECKKGNHRKIWTRHYHYTTSECECGKFKYLHDDEDGLTIRMK